MFLCSAIVKIPIYIVNREKDILCYWMMRIVWIWMHEKWSEQIIIIILYFAILKTINAYKNWKWTKHLPCLWLSAFLILIGTSFHFQMTKKKGVKINKMLNFEYFPYDIRYSNTHKMLLQFPFSRSLKINFREMQ